MDIIYIPKGSAREYAALGLNIYKGCTHRCRYCYCAHNRYTDKEAYFSSPQPKNSILSRVHADCEKLLKTQPPESIPEILMSFQGDCYQPAEMSLHLTREVIKILITHHLSFTILTKGGTCVLRDFDLLAGYPNFRLGMSLSLLSPVWVKMYEPEAPPPEDRMDALRRAKDAGIPTWVSLEPVIDPLQAMQIIHLCKEFVDHWKIGKIQHAAISHDTNWPAARKDIEDYLIDLKADYVLKKSLKGG